jgi:hypothetical protein
LIDVAAVRHDLLRAVCHIDSRPVDDPECPKLVGDKIGIKI